jgi:hypothetical protein
VSRRNCGLTLIEVLIASVIVFGVVGLTVDMYRSSLLSTEKAHNEVTALLAVQVLLPRIQRELVKFSDQETVSGSGSFGDVGYVYRASTIAFDPPPQEFDVETGVLNRFQPRFRLYDVQLTIASKSGAQKRFAYKELAWTEFLARAD